MVTYNLKIDLQTFDMLLILQLFSHYKDLQNEAARLAVELSEINEARQQIRARILEQL